MFCKYCGNELDNNTAFCDKCGKPVYGEGREKKGTATHKRGKYRRKRRSPIKPVLCIVGVAILCAGILGVGLSLLNSSDPGTNTNEITIVQNGYLGEYTDITVKEILDSLYGMLYENEEWDGGITDSGSVIVQARYYDEGMEEDAMTIQFTMLNEKCFKITAFVDPMNPVEKATDLLAAMNYNYLIAYMGENRAVSGDSVAEKEFIARLDQISGSAVQYGAAADYTGNRATVCEMDGQTPLDVSVAMLLDNYGLLDMSYYWDTDILEQTSSTEPDETESSVAATEPSKAEYDADEMLLAVLKGERSFIMSDTNEAVSIAGVKKVGYDEFDSPLIPILYAYADMDQDGQQEVIVELTNNVDGWRVILRYQDGAVYGFGYHYRGLQSISTSGLVMASSGAAYSDVFRLQFDYGEVKEEYLSSIETENALDSWIDVEWFDYGNMSSSAASLEETSGEYPLDFAGCNTESVVNTFGTNFIYEDGYVGSKLFYYGNEPDVHYGFIPNDWGNPVLTGSEPITIIILSGDAQINAYLSADMNKAEIDAVAWETPDVQNVSNGNDYTMMSGNTYGYKIETSSAIIMYTWYLDNGDSIESAASEIVIVPK